LSVAFLLRCSSHIADVVLFEVLCLLLCGKEPYCANETNDETTINIVPSIATSDRMNV
jgi:hypothetical protein